MHKNGQGLRNVGVGNELKKTSKRRVLVRCLPPGRRMTLAAGGKQLLFPDLQRLRQKNHLGISHATDLRLDFGNRVFANVPSRPCAARGQHGLGPALAVTDFSHDRTDDILRSGFAHDFPLTLCQRGLVFIPISEGTDREQKPARRLPACLHRTARKYRRQTNTLSRGGMPTIL